jgi:DNA-binding MarR family transcriptional regulator
VATGYAQYLLRVEKRRAGSPGSKHPQSTAFLLAQVGAQAAALFASRLRELDLAPPHAGVLRVIASTSGVSQKVLAARLGMFPSRLVAMLDELEARGLIERRDNINDRRLHALHLTEKGAKMMAEIGRVARAHDDAICAALTEKERGTLWAMLMRIAAEQNLTPGVHPGFARMTDVEGKRSDRKRQPRTSTNWRR